MVMNRDPEESLYSASPLANCGYDINCTQRIIIQCCSPTRLCMVLEQGLCCFTFVHSVLHGVRHPAGVPLMFVGLS